MLYSLNLMSGVMDGFRWALLGAGHPPRLPFWVSVGAALVTPATGAPYFRRMEKIFRDMEKTFADRV